MSRGWTFSDWYTCRTRRDKAMEAADAIAALGYTVCLPPMTHGLNIVLVKFDLYKANWWEINRAPNVVGLLMDGFVKWPVAITRTRLAQIKAELEKEQAEYLKVGSNGLPSSTEFTAYRHAALRLYSTTSQTQNETLLKRRARQATQAPSILC